jgi:hypothetical protein
MVLSILSSSLRRFHKPRRISTLKIKNIIFCVYLIDHKLSYEYVSSIQGRSQDGAKVEDFKYLSKGKNISSTYLISITSLPEDEQTSKHGGGGRYNAIWSSRGENKKKEKNEKKLV